MGNAKESCSQEAVKLVEKGMTVGLGTGSTTAFFIKFLAEREKNEGLGLSCVATSRRSEELAKSLGLRVFSLEEIEKIDLAVDGADQIDSSLCLIKGLGGGAITREKVVDYKAGKFIVIADEGKLVKKLSGNVPVEVIPFAARPVMQALGQKGASKISFRKNPDGSRLVTDNGNLILDCWFEKIGNPPKMEAELKLIPGVLENGLFSKKVWKAIIGLESGGVKTLG